MKTHFIENTNKQYSIREDGQVIINYTKYANKIQKVNKVLNVYYKKNKNYLTPTVSIRINNKKTVLLIETLLYKYFNIQKCRKCNSSISHKDRKWLCFKCNYINHLFFVKRYANNNKDKVSNIQKKHSIIRINSLKNSYVAGLLNTPQDILPNNIINAKKQQLLFHRTLKKLKNEHSKQLKNS
jgi:hypothetical protein